VKSLDCDKYYPVFLRWKHDSNSGEEPSWPGALFPAFLIFFEIYLAIFDLM